RTNYAAALAGGRDIGLPGPPDVLALAERLGFGRGLGAVTAFATSVLLGVDARTGRHPSLDGALRSGLSEPDAARRILSLVLSSLEAQKCWLRAIEQPLSWEVPCSLAVPSSAGP